MSDPAGSKVPCPVHMHMHLHFVIGPDSPEKGFQKGSGYEKMKTMKKYKNEKMNEKTNENIKNENPKVFRIPTKNMKNEK